METQFMVKKKTEVPLELLSKKFLKQFKTEEDVSKFLKDLHSQVLEQMLQGEMDAHLGYEKHDVAGNNTGNSRNGSFPKTIQTEHGESTRFPGTGTGNMTRSSFPNTKAGDYP